MLEAFGLSKSYSGSVALDQPNLTIHPGEIFCLLGTNGACKTTTWGAWFVPKVVKRAKLSVSRGWPPCSYIVSELVAAILLLTDLSYEILLRYSVAA
jgi:ABC-type ATPase with predicted acetyltransferase domain